MPTTEGIAFLAASEKLAIAGVLTGVEVSCSSTTWPDLSLTREMRSGRSVVTTKSAARHNVQACAKKSQTRRSKGASGTGTGANYRQMLRCANALVAVRTDGVADPRP